MWSLKFDWDDEVSENVTEKWQTFRLNLHHINQITIPRHVLCKEYKNVELHGFCDASQDTYGAHVYTRCTKNLGEVTTKLFRSKGKLASLRSISIPRLRLCGALVLVRRIDKIRTSITINANYYY